MIRFLKKLIANKRLEDFDLVEMQFFASRYANQNQVGTRSINNITAKMIEIGIMPKVDKNRGAAKPTIWVKDGAYGWPSILIQRYGWDGRKITEDK